MQTLPIPELGIELFSCTSAGEESERYFLIPSPEVGMKSLLVAGAGDIFQLGHCFRREPWPGRWHGLEFCMLEWYRLGADYRDNLIFTQNLLAYLTEDYPSFPHSWVEKTMDQLFAELLGVSLSEHLSAPGLIELHQRFGQRWQEGESEEQLFHRLFLSLIEPHFKHWGGVVVTDYPALIPTLAKRRDDDVRYAERWELYVDGVELVNCCTEENRKPWLDEYFPPGQALAKLYQDLPFCSGAALGLDRLALLLNAEATDRLWQRR